jgi:hypothetical protein
LALALDVTNSGKERNLGLDGVMLNVSLSVAVSQKLRLIDVINLDVVPYVLSVSGNTLFDKGEKI